MIPCRTELNLYFTKNGKYRYARAFMTRFLGCEISVIGSDEVDTATADIFLGVDPFETISTQAALSSIGIANAGIYICFIICDHLSFVNSHLKQSDDIARPIWYLL